MSEAEKALVNFQNSNDRYWSSVWRRHPQHDDTQYNDTQRNKMQLSAYMLSVAKMPNIQSVVMLSVVAPHIHTNFFVHKCKIRTFSSVSVSPK